MMVLDVIIIGGGPAGLTAALYCGRARLTTLVLERAQCGGQVLLTDIVENFPGIPDMKASRWSEVLKGQVLSLEGVRVTEDAKVERLLSHGRGFTISGVSEVDGVPFSYEAKAVVVATGAQPKRLGIPGEKELTGRGVSYCATCDAPLFRDKSVVVVGGGDTALEEALFLRKYAKTVTLVHRRDGFRAAAVLQERVKRDLNIHLKLGFVPVEVLGKTKVEGLKIKGVGFESVETLAADGVFFFVGFLPDTGLVKDLALLDETGWITTDESMVTKVPGLFACGDCRRRPLYQIVTACGEGAVAAASAIKFIEHAAGSS